jgi:conjugal transfer pilin signal peptidase TrbI
MNASEKAEYQALSVPQRAMWLWRALSVYFSRHWKNWAIGVLCLLLFNAMFKVGINVTESLPQKVFIVTKFNHHVERGDYMSFVWHGTAHYRKGFNFVKIVRGVPGDTVSFIGRDVYVNGQFVAQAKPKSLKGEPLELGPSGVIPLGKYFVYATNKDSLDSRYALTGWIDEKNIIGKAYGLY